MRGEPTKGVDTDNLRYRNMENGHIGPLIGRDGAGTFDSLPTTLEEEASNGGWTNSNRPTGPAPRRLYTLGMRGEPGYDDDPVPDGRGGYTDTGEAIDSADRGSSWD